MKKPFKRRLSLRSMLVLISLLFLLMPLGSIYFLRIYESTLIRQTESELISQGAFVAALYKNQVAQMLKSNHLNAKTYGVPSKIKVKNDNTILPIPARLDLAKDKIHPARPLAKVTNDHLDPIAEQAGEMIVPILQDAQRITLSGIKLLDYQGIVIAGKDEHGLSFAHAEEFRLAKLGVPVHLLRTRRMPNKKASLNSFSRNTSINVFIALPIVLDDRLIGVVWLNRTPPDVIQALYGKRREILWTTFWLLLITGAITFATSYAITRPIRLLVQKTKLVTLGDPKGLEPIEHPITAEVAQLSESLTKMAKTLQYRADYIQNFARHVSHEFKTPLTSMQGSVELLQDDLQTMPLEQQQRFLSNIHQDVERLTLLVSRLMELAKADMTEVFNTPVAIVPILKEIQQQYSSERFKIQLSEIPENQSHLSVYAPEDAIRAVLIHLIENSIQAGAAQIDISLSQAANILQVRVHDNGPGISTQNQLQIFTPFFTTKRAKGGTGLGLSISKSLIERLGGNIAVVASENGACFEIMLPKATI